LEKYRHLWSILKTLVEFAKAKRGQWCPMIGKTDKSKVVAGLRWRAEEIVKEQVVLPPKDPATLSHEEALRLIHELRVHQVELQMQNDELCRAQAELSATREHYFDLFNLAPVGYFIVSHEGRILEANLAGVTLLGVLRAALVKQPVTRFIFKEDQDVYYLHRRELLATGKAHACELRMVKADGTPFWARLTASMQEPSATAGSNSAPTSHVVLSDISERKQIEQEKAQLDARLQQAKHRSRVGPKPGKVKSRKKAARR
jgi:PAS domain S-box-containing protein